MPDAMINMLVKIIVIILVVVVVTVSVLMVWKAFVEPALEQIGGTSLFGTVKA